MGHQDRFALLRHDWSHGRRTRRLAWIGCGAFAAVLTVSSVVIGSVAFDQVLEMDPWALRPEHRLTRLHGRGHACVRTPLCVPGDGEIEPLCDRR